MKTIHRLGLFACGTLWPYRSLSGTQRDCPVGCFVQLAKSLRGECSWLDIRRLDLRRYSVCFALIFSLANVRSHTVALHPLRFPVPSHSAIVHFRWILPISSLIPCLLLCLVFFRSLGLLRVGDRTEATRSGSGGGKEGGLCRRLVVAAG